MGRLRGRMCEGSGHYRGTGRGRLNACQAWHTVPMPKTPERPSHDRTEALADDVEATPDTPTVASEGDMNDAARAELERRGETA